MSAVLPLAVVPVMTRFPAALRLLLATAVLLPLLTSCSSSNLDGYDVSDIARFTLPYQRNVPSHPDSLRFVRVVEEDQTVGVATERSFESLARDWSVSRRDIGPATEALPVVDYATFWGMDLSLLSLEVEMGISALSKDRALELVEKRKNDVRSEIQIDVYWFERPTANTVPGPNAKGEIRVDDGTRYRATRSEYGPIRDSFLPDGSRVLYRRCTFYFDRIQDDKDILAGSETLRLDVRRFADPIEDTFIWSWEEAVEEAADRTARKTADGSER
ncbi:MAG: hypothetical protein GVY25_07060 [Bacteroidetes bacterium]|jgi:hypothetical protein|nr:hypothetical protein [Bacteroidota bacterium]